MRSSSLRAQRSNPEAIDPQSIKTNDAQGMYGALDSGWRGNGA